MKEGKVNFVVDGFHGSSGKGKIAAYLASRDRPRILLSTNMPNAGHTAMLAGQKFISKILPTAAILNKWLYNYKPIVVLGGSSSFYLERLLLETKECELDPSQLIIHPRAGVVLPEHAQRERETLDGPKSIASTMQGCATFMSDKILRKPGVKLAKDYTELMEYVAKGYVPIVLRDMLKNGDTILAEVSQGVGLDILHGSHYPNCTSRCCTPMQFATDFGINPADFGEVYLNTRPYPIRVGNVVEDGKVIGYSGDFFSDAQEITWEEIGRRAGMPNEEIKKLLSTEMTTVTKRLRRVFEFSEEGLEKAVAVTGATKLVLNFAQYIDWKAHKVTEYKHLPKSVKDYVAHLEEITGLPVALIGTGISNEDMIDRELEEMRQTCPNFRL